MRLLGGMLATTLLVLSACSSDDGDETPDADPTPSESLDVDGLAGVVADAPTDVRWLPGDAPDTWRELQGGPGEAQWQVGERCALSLNQFDDLDQDPSFSQEDLLEDYVGRLGDTLPDTVSAGPVEDVSFPVESNVDGSMTSRVSRADLVAEGDSGLGGEIYTYRSGGFGLIALATCGGDTFQDVRDSEIRPFLDELRIGATY